MKKGIRVWEIFIVVGIVVLLSVAWLYGSATYKLNVKPGLTIGDILYASAKDKLTNLNIGTSGQRLAGGTSAPQYLDQNLLGANTLAVTAADTTILSAVQARSLYWKITSVSGSYAKVIEPPNVAGYIYLIWNSSGQTLTVRKTGGSGETLASTKFGFCVHNGSDYVVKTLD